MNDSSIAHWTLERVRDAIATGEVSARDATEACVARLEGSGRTLNAVAGLDAETALAAADAADATPKDDRGPLHGVPLAHKDMFYRKGRVSACGSGIRADFVPDVTASVLARLDAAGALDIARLNMVEFAFGLTGHNDITGVVRNPWNADYITGGSSSGSGSMVGARAVFGALGSDTGGSIRFPSACCGVVGMKMTWGRVSRFGCMPLSSSLDTIGPLTRTVRDNAMIFQAIAGPDTDPAATDDTTAQIAVPDALGTIEDGAKGLRIGVPSNLFLDMAEPEIGDVVEAAIKVYRDLGAEIISVDVPPETAYGNTFTSMIASVEGYALHAHWLATRYQDYGAQTAARLLTGSMVPANRYAEALMLRAGITGTFVDAVYDRVDALLVPVLMTGVPTIEESDVGANPGFMRMVNRAGHATRPANYMGLPSLTLPFGFDAAGLPYAFQLMGRPFGEGILYRAGRAFERETLCTDPAPDL